MSRAGEAAIVDVVVAGAGPAGSVTALLFARQGLKVVLLERHVFPRSKACGDCLSPAANMVLQRIGILEEVLQASPARITGWKLTSVGHESFSALFSEVTDLPVAQFALAIERERLDAVLLECACRAGVEVIQNARVTDLLRSGDRIEGLVARLDNETRHFRARLTVGADGLRSIIARRLNAYTRSPRLRKASFTMHVDKPVELPMGEMRLGRNACLGIAPVLPDLRRHNLTLVLTDGAFDAHSGVKRIVQQGLAGFGIELPDDGVILTSGPFDWPVSRVAYPGAVLVGDAAGYYDPFTGQGIYKALAGAELLASNLADDLRTGEVRASSLAAYAAAHAKLARPTHRIQRIIEYVCARPRLGDLLFRKFSRDELLAHALIAVTGDLTPPGSLFSPRLLLRLAT